MASRKHNNKNGQWYYVAAVRWGWERYSLGSFPTRIEAEKAEQEFRDLHGLNRSEAARRAGLTKRMHGTLPKKHPVTRQWMKANS